jgi:hypothetical protein
MLKVASLYDIETQVDISVACYVTHNVIRLHNGGVSLALGATEDINQNNMLDAPEGDDEYGNDVSAFNNLHKARNDMRDDMVKRMWRITLQDEQVMDREFVLGYHASNHLC